MTSECFVYITLPGETQPVTAGRFELSQNQQGVMIGRFVYGRSYRERPNAVAIDPVELKLSDRVYETAALNGVFGALRDASPDYWGRRVIQRHLGRADPSELDYLLHSPDDRAGALGFGLNQTPPSPLRLFNRTMDLDKLQSTADAIMADESLVDKPDANQVEKLIKLGTSMGGARPKAVIEDNDCLWLAKFSSKEDQWNNARVEHSMLVLARQCGLTTAESRIIQVAGRDVVLIKRFDREKVPDGYNRARMISGLTLLGAEDTHRSRDKWSYVLMVEELRRISAEPEKDAAELFRRMLFNALISNIDDHPRNHAVIAKNKDWRLSPAYDLTPGSSISSDHRDLALVCGDAGRYANAENLLSQSARFLLKRAEAEAIIAEMEAKIKAIWYNVARGEGVSEQDCRTIAGAFVYPGFRYPMSTK
jgi:serine/threonine-protein kinase HipA